MKCLLLLIGAVSAFFPPPDIGFKIPEKISIPSVIFVPSKTLKLYGLDGTYGSEFAGRPPVHELIEAMKLSDKIIKDLAETNATVGEYFTEFWKSIENSTVREYLQWSTAHSFNFLFASQLIAEPVEKALFEAEKISKGECQCPSTPRLASEFSRICAEKECVVIEKEIQRAKLVVENILETKNFLRNIIKAYEEDLLSVNEKINGELAFHLEAARKFSSEFDEIYKVRNLKKETFGQNYEYFNLREMAYLTDKTIEELLAILDQGLHRKETANNHKRIYVIRNHNELLAILEEYEIKVSSEQEDEKEE